MTNATVGAMKSLRDGLVAEPLAIEAELTIFPSGSAMLDVRRAGRAFVMAYTPTGGYAVDELHPGDGFVTAYQFVFDDFEPAAQQLRALATSEIPTESPSPGLSLVVLQSRNVEATRDFYSTLGLSFVEEQHGKGPRHYSAALGPVVLEIYPCQGTNSHTPMHIGFRIPFLDRTLAKLRSRGSRIVREAVDSPWGRRAVVEDPDGNHVELACVEVPVSS